MQGVAEIVLLRGHVALVDVRDYDRLSRFNWRLNGGYAQVGYKTDSGIYTYAFMHRIIAGALPHESVDHVNGNPLDNRRENLRIATTQQNCMNRRKKKTSTSRFKGVHFRRESGKWRAAINKNKKRYLLGSFAAEKDAAIAYNLAAIELFGSYAKLNQVEDEQPE